MTSKHRALVAYEDSPSWTAPGRETSISGATSPAVIIIHEEPGLHPLVIPLHRSSGGGGHDS